jgi:hypothetical protein
MAHDKKGAVGRPEFVLLAGPGVGKWDIAIEESVVNELWNL